MNRLLAALALLSLLRAPDALAVRTPAEWASAFETARVGSPGFAVESVEEFQKITEQHERLLSDGVTLSSFALSTGERIQCVEVSSQGSIVASGQPLQPAPGALPPAGRTNQGTRPLSAMARPGSEFGLDGSRDADGMERACPSQSFPRLVPTLDRMYRFRTLDDFFRKTPGGGRRPASSTRSSVSVTPDISGPPHEYAHAYRSVNNTGMSATFNLWSPFVQAAGEFSLSQLWVTRGLTTDNSLQTAETGWQVSPSYGDARAHYFIYHTTGNYQTGTGCYNLDCTGFIQTDNSVVLGGAWTTYSTQGGTQYDATFAFFRDSSPPYNWWLKYGDTMVGYFPNSLYNSAGLANYSSEIDFGGEIVNTSTGGLHTTTQMGSGQFSSGGFGVAAYIKQIHYWDTSGTFLDAAGLIPAVTNASYYDIALGTSPDSSAGVFFYFGGPGRVSDAAPTAAFTVSGNPRVGLPVQFTDTSSGGPTSWAWTFGDGGSSTAQNPSHTFASAQTYTVSLTASNSSGSNARSQGVTVLSGGSQGQGFTYVLPSSAHSTGANRAFYTTDLSVSNRGSTTANLTIQFVGHDQNGSGGPQVQRSLPAGTSTTYADVLSSLFGVSSGYGGLLITSDSGSLKIVGQTSTPPPSGPGTFGQSVPALTSASFVTPTTSQALIALRQDSAFRTNAVLMNASSVAVHVSLVLVGANGSTLGSSGVDLAPESMTQLSGVVTTLGGPSGTRDAVLVVSTTTPGAQVACYASLIDQTTNDPRTILP